MAKRTDVGESFQQAKDQAKDLAQGAKEQAKDMANQARDHVQSFVGQQKDQAADRLHALADKLEIAQRVHFAGDLVGEALDAAWQSADAFALATHYEGYGMAYAEAPKAKEVKVRRKEKTRNVDKKNIPKIDLFFFPLSPETKNVGWSTQVGQGQHCRHEALV